MNSTTETTTTDDEQLDRSRCQNCGAHVDPTFRRVYGDSQGIVERCFNCSRKQHLRD